MTVELCFRLCRQWKILINENRTLCMCLYRISKRQEFNEFLGNVISINKCESNNLQIYSLTNDFDLLPPLAQAPYDWSLDGCYYLQGIQNYGANLALSNSNYDLALEQCRNHCQMVRQGNSISFFLSLKKSCYCLPIGVTFTALSTAVRKPLMHCSFLSCIKDGFENYINISEINSDTVAKIDLKRYCSSSFYVFNRFLHRCLNLIPFGFRNNFAKVNSNEMCVPLLIRTSQQFNYLTSLPIILRTRVLTKIDPNSTYVFEELLKSNRYSVGRSDFCLVMYKSVANRPSTYEIFPCPITYSSGYVLCSQKVLERVPSDQPQVKLLNTSESTSIIVNVSCPLDFVLFNNMCYYVHSLYVFNLTDGEQFCSNKHPNSTLVRFDSHAWGNVNSTGFLGRTFNDMLLEFFYYQLEKRLFIESINMPNQKHWLRLLLGDKKDPNECVLRYFIRRLGAFTTLAQCDHGGHPVCQHEPISISILNAETTTETIIHKTHAKNDSFEIDTITEISVINTTLSISKNWTNLSTTSNESIISMCDNCTTIIPDEDLPNNETDFDLILNNSVTKASKTWRFNYRSNLAIGIGIFIVLAIVTTSTVGLIYYCRHTCGSYSMRNNTRRSPHRIELRSPLGISNKPSNRFAVLYQRLKPPSQSSTTDAHPSQTCDNSKTNDDTVQLLPQSTDDNKQNQNLIIIKEEEEEEEPLYAILQPCHEK